MITRLYREWGALVESHRQISIYISLIAEQQLFSRNWSIAVRIRAKVSSPKSPAPSLFFLLSSPTPHRFLNDFHKIPYASYSLIRSSDSKSLA